MCVRVVVGTTFRASAPTCLCFEVKSKVRVEQGLLCLEAVACPFSVWPSVVSCACGAVSFPSHVDPAARREHVPLCDWPCLNRMTYKHPCCQVSVTALASVVMFSDKRRRAHLSRRISHIATCLEQALRFCTGPSLFVR